jgi:hypothetical protein
MTDPSQYDAGDGSSTHRPVTTDESRANRSFWLHLCQAAGYPLRRNGRRVLLAGSLAVAGLSALWSVQPEAAGFLGTFVIAYLAMYFFHAIGESARGDHDPPAWVSLRAMRETAGAILPMFMALGLYGVLPCLVLLVSVSEWPGGQPGTLGTVLVMLLGLALLPMATLATGWFRSPEGLHPGLILRSVARVPGPYLAVCGVILLVATGLWLAAVPLSRSSTVQWVLRVVLGSGSFYVLLVSARALGLILWCYDDRLGWGDGSGKRRNGSF